MNVCHRQRRDDSYDSWFVVGPLFFFDDYPKAHLRDDVSPPSTGAMDWRLGNQGALPRGEGTALRGLLTRFAQVQGRRDTRHLDSRSEPLWSLKIYWLSLN